MKQMKTLYNNTVSTKNNGWFQSISDTPPKKEIIMVTDTVTEIKKKITKLFYGSQNAQ